MVDCEQIGGLRKVQNTTADTAKIRIALGSFGISSSANRLIRAAFAIVQLGRPWLRGFQAREGGQRANCKCLDMLWHMKTQPTHSFHSFSRAMTRGATSGEAASCAEPLGSGQLWRFWNPPCENVCPEMQEVSDHSMKTIGLHQPAKAQYGT